MRRQELERVQVPGLELVREWELARRLVEPWALGREPAQEPERVQARERVPVQERVPVLARPLAREQARVLRNLRQEWEPEALARAPELARERPRVSVDWR